MKIICIGHNYAAHAKELNHPLPSEPLFFMKPDTALLRNNADFYIPDFSNDLHYELELIIKINRIGKCISEKFAPRYYSEIGLGIDFTARDLQRNCIEKGLPWEICKAFDSSAVISQQFVNINKLGNLNNIQFHLNINSNTVQKGNSGDMIFNFDKIIAHVSKYISLRIGDLIYTGTPVGVGPVKPNDRLQGYMNNELMFDFFVK